MTEQEARDDEREALACVLLGVRRIPLDPEWPRHADALAQADAILAWMQAEGYRRHPEPEITDEMVQRASASLHEWGLPDVPPELESTIARDALEAAFESSARVSEPTATVSSDG